MEAYSVETPLRPARDIYFRHSGLGPDGGYSAAWVRFGIGPLRVPVPNTPARRAALPLHDLHHIAAGYSTSWTGEGEIAAWELALQDLLLFGSCLLPALGGLALGWVIIRGVLAG